jgi:hypothetical protein
MESQLKTLASVIRSTSQQGQGQDTNTTPNMLGWNAYLTFFGINCVYRFPDVSDIESIDYDTVHSVAEFSAACSKIALQTWTELQTPVNVGRSNLRARAV